MDELIVVLFTATVCITAGYIYLLMLRYSINRIFRDRLNSLKLIETNRAYLKKYVEFARTELLLTAVELGFSYDELKQEDKND